MPASSDYASPTDVTSTSPEPLSYEDDPELERGQSEYVFIHSTPLQGIYPCSQHFHTTISPLVEHNGLEGDEVEEEISSASSAGFVVATHGLRLFTDPTPDKRRGPLPATQPRRSRKARVRKAGE